MRVSFTRPVLQTTASTYSLDQIRADIVELEKKNGRITREIVGGGKT